jgi:hypothetical protein
MKEVHIFDLDARFGFTTWKRNWRERFLFLKSVATDITASLDETPRNLEGNYQALEKGSVSKYKQCCSMCPWIFGTPLSHPVRQV